MRFGGIFLTTVMLCAMSGCSSDSGGDGASASPPTAVSTPQTSEPTVDAPAQLPDHVLKVTIHDQLPLDAYKASNGGKCVSTAVAGAPHQLAVDGSKYKEFDIPVSAQLLRDGSCRSSLTVTVRGAPKYTLGVVIEGKGISSPTDPGDTIVSSQGASQSVTVAE